MWVVVQPDSPHYGIVISRHRSEQAAKAAIERELKDLRAQPGQRASWLDRVLVETDSRKDRVALYGECDVCDEPISRERFEAAKSRGEVARYCGERHKNTAAMRRQRARQRQEA